MKHVFPSDLVENETAAALRRVLYYLEEHGWCQGTAQNRNGNVCIEQAIHRVGGGLHSASAKFVLDVTGSNGIARWNDSPTTTFADVRAVLLTAIDTASA